MTAGTERETVSKGMPMLILEPLEEARKASAADVGRHPEHLVGTEG